MEAYKSLTIRLPVLMADAITARAQELGVSQNKVVLGALRQNKDLNRKERQLVQKKQVIRKRRM